MADRAVETHWLVLGTGGTVAGRAALPQDNLGYRAGQLGIETLVHSLALPAPMNLRAEQVAQIDSKDMDFEVWRALALRCMRALGDPAVAGIVITHGTDTMEETAFFLHAVLDAIKPVVLTGAMRPASAFAPDGPQNLRDALGVAAAPDARGVMVVFAGRVHDAVAVQKVHSYRLDAFSSADAGPIAHVEEGAVRCVRPWPARESAPCPVDAWANAAALPRVEIVWSHAGASGALIDMLLRERVADPAMAIQGLVLVATGNGTLHHRVEAAALRARQAGVTVLRATRCQEGRIFLRTEDRLRDAGGLSPVKARIALMLELLTTQGGGSQRDGAIKDGAAFSSPEPSAPGE